MKENSMSYRTAKQETERLICEIEEMTITHRAYTAECLRRVLKENELLRKDIEGWKKYCEEIEEEQTEMSNKNCELEFKVEKLQKENEELKNDYENLNNSVVVKNYYIKNSIPIQKVKDKIEKYKKLSDKFYVKFLESDRYNIDIREKGIKCDAIILALEELIEEREEK